MFPDAAGTLGDTANADLSGALGEASAAAFSPVPWRGHQLIYSGRLNAP